MRSHIAITRGVSASIARCELTHLERTPIDLELARAQHLEYERTLGRLGCDVRRLPTSEDWPDGVFVEDAAVVLDEVAVVTRPGAASRRGETAAVADVLSTYRRLAYIVAPGTLDGGDVLTVGRSIFVGLSSRTNSEGIEQMRRAVEPFGYTVSTATVEGCLHLKSAATAVDDATLLVNRRWIVDREFGSLELVDVDPDEPMAANVARVGPNLLYPSAFPRTRERLERRGFAPAIVDVSELAKAEGAVTCCSLILFAAN